MYCNEIKIVDKKRRKNKLLYNGHSYHLYKNVNNTKHWICVYRKCKGYIITGVNNKIISIKDHDKCVESYYKNEALSIRDKVYKRAVNTNERTEEIFMELKIAPHLILKKLPEIKNLNDKITKYRKRMKVNIFTGDIPEKIKFTYSYGLFLQYDSEINDLNKFLKFTTYTHMVHLNNAQNWYCDGTFKSFPKKISQ
ncbi:hypothetical protein DMUE_3772 [Dictyocoela muelleri]|nr:hypothetical protein DMUE_3772 [Dictyocoela muelleri]